MDLSLDDVCEFINGGAWSDDEYADEGIRVVKVTNMRNGTISDEALDHLPASKYEKYKRHELRPNDLVVATVGSHPNQPGSVVGRTSRIPASFGGAFLNQNAACLRVKRPDLVDQRFLCFLSETVLFKHHIESRARGSANQVRMAIGDLRQFTISYPPLPTQRKIAAVLAAYDDLIEANRRRIALLERMAEEIYREWFVRLRFPGHATTKITKGIPAGWRVVRLGSVLELRYGKALKGEDRVPGPYAVYGSSGIVGSHNEAHVQGPGLIVGRKGNVGSVFLADAGFFVIDTAFYVESSLPHSFLYFLLGSMNFINNDSAVPGLNRNQAYANQMFLPPELLIAEFAKIVDVKFQATRTLRAQNAHLTRTRDLLLPRLISGKLDVADLPIAFPPSMATPGP